MRCEYRIRHRNGTYRWVEDRLRLFRDETGTPKEIVGLWSDVTARKEAETAIVQVEKRADRIRLITGIVITTGLAVVIFSLGVGLDLFVPLLRWILQHRDTVVDEIVGSFLFICLATLFYAAWMLRATQTEVGAHRKVEAALQLLHDELESRVQNRTSELTRTNETLRAEIAERQRTQAALSEERALMRTLIDQIPDSIYIKDRNQRFVLANQGAAQVLGVASPAELLGKHDRELFPSAQAETFAADDERVIKGDAIFNQEESLLALDGKERTLLTTKFPLRDLTGNITGLVGIGRDITARKRLETELLRAQRVESIGRLASGIAHDMNNILAPIMMSASLLRTPRLAPKAVETTLQTIESSAKRGADLVKQLLLFGRGGEGGRGVVNFRKMVDELASIARETFPRNIVFKTEVPANLWTVEADATQLHQVLLNLCVNARDAMPSGGTLTVGASNVTLDEAACRPHPAASPGPYLCVTVSDTGTGIPPEIAAKIFEPFFTTKEIGRGTGLGLATVLSVMEAHAGFISLESEIGRGTCFRLHLPAKPNAKEAMEKGSGASPAGRGELILVVDDERYIREIISQILLTHNYRVIEASDGVEALALFAQHPEVDLLLTDIDMPNLDGIGLVERLRQQKPTLPIVVSSGLADAKNNALRQEQLQPYGLSQILAKPCTKDQVLHRIAEELNAAAESIRSPTGVVTRG